MIIFGKDERAKVEALRNKLSSAVLKIYDNVQTYHNGKWVMFKPTDTALFDDFVRLLSIKRKLNKNKQ